VPQPPGLPPASTRAQPQKGPSLASRVLIYGGSSEVGVRSASMSKGT